MAQKNSIDNLMMTFADLSASNKGKNKSIMGLVLKAESTLQSALQDGPDVQS